MEVTPIGGIDTDSSFEFRATTKNGLLGDGCSEVGVDGEDEFCFLAAVLLAGLGLYLSCGALLLIGCMRFTALSTGAGIGRSGAKFEMGSSSTCGC